MEGLLVKSPEEMITLWRSFAKKYKKILLYWDLWAWKTQFVKGFANWLGIDSSLVQSPTYTYMNIYDGRLLHIDMYRLNDFNDLIDKGILEQIEQFEYIVIEWPKREEEYADENWKKIIIEKIDKKTRKIKF